MDFKNTKLELSAIITKNDKLIQELKTLQLLNEKEMTLYHLIENSPSFSIPKTYYNAVTKFTPKIDPVEEAVKKLQINAAIKIQNAYRKHLFRCRCNEKFQQWSVINARKSIELINKISKTITKTSVPNKFDLKLWKNEYKTFETQRKRRAELFEKRNTLLQEIKKEQAFLASDFQDNSQMKALKPYKTIKAEEELKWRLECAEDEAFIAAL
uniref:Uncharacterized protein n=1 Tax=Panagrolaimus davidi TaxID=227884 RepID=A0A914QED4_9BILA